MPSKVTLIEHPLIQHKLTLIRDQETNPKEFRELINEVAMLMAYEVTRDLPLKTVQVQTPVAICESKAIGGRKIAVIPILRAGLGMVDGIINLIPSALIGHIGIYRDPETLKPVEYYCKLPLDIDQRDVIIVDPMLATGHTAAAAIDFLKQRGCRNGIKFVSMIASPEGLEVLKDAHDDIEIFIAAIDERLDEHGYIVPGLGDAGDRLFGTK